MDKDSERRGLILDKFLNKYGEELFDEKPSKVNKEHARSIIWHLFWDMFGDMELDDEVSESDFLEYKEEMKEYFQFLSDFRTGKFNFYALMHIDTGQKTEKTPNLEWYDWDFTFYYLPEEEESDLLEDIPDEPALHYRAIRRDRVYMCNF